MNQNLGKQFLFLFIFIFISNNFLYSQSGCYNSDFSAGNFSGWHGFYGNYTDPEKSEGFVTGRHTIIDTATFDPNTCGGLSTIPQGESSSARLGNQQTRAQAEKLVYDILVTELNSLFIYKYAIVVEDPGHDFENQPSFSVKIIKSNGEAANPACGFYEVYAGQSNQNFQNCLIIDPIEPDIKKRITWSPWKTVGLNLSSYIGENLSIEFTTKDCSFGAHFGYAYISTKCSDFKIDLNVCSSEDNFTLTAPEGFEKYLWSYLGETVGAPSRNITLALKDYPVGANFECAMTSFSNINVCEVKLQAILNPTVINTAFSTSMHCYNNQTTFNPITFYNQTTITNGNIDQWNWDFGDGTTSTEQNPQHIFINSGNYTVTLKATSETGCTSGISENINIDNNPIPIPAINSNQKFCSLPSPSISSIETNGQEVQWFDSLASTVPLVSTSILNDTSTYYCALVNTNGCLGPRMRVFISFATTAAPKANATQSFCLIDSPKVANLIASGDSILWYTTLAGSIPLKSSTPLIDNTVYFASQTDAQTGCESDIRLPVRVMLYDDSANLQDDYIQNICIGDNLSIKNLYVDGKDTKYYDSRTSETPLAPNYQLTNGSTYYASVINPQTSCESLERTSITVNIIPCELKVYNTISINNNGLNDYLVIKHIEYFPENTLEVYNRFGQLVYKTSKYGINNNLFYGEANAGEVFNKHEKLPSGSYFYIINYKNDSSSVNKIQKGFLYINNNG